MVYRVPARPDLASHEEWLDQLEIELASEPRPADRVAPGLSQLWAWSFLFHFPMLARKR